MNHTTYYKKIKESIEKIISEEDKVMIGVSGGSDSMYLLFTIQQIRKTKNRKPSLLHIVSCDHNTRENTKIEIETVKKASIENNFYTEKYNGSAHTEKDMRKRRHEIFEKYCTKNNIKYIFLGHHLDDRIESTLLHMKRGCQKKGLRGMEKISSHFLNPNLYIVRPLLFLQKKEILTECKQLGIVYHEDPTNKDSNYSERNKIRNILIKHFNTDGRYNSRKKYYETIEKKTTNIEQTKNYTIRTNSKQENIINICYDERTVDILYEIYEYHNIKINPRSNTLENLCNNLRQKSGNKIQYQGLVIQGGRFGSIIKKIE